MKLVLKTIGVLAVSSFAGLSQAQDYPSKLITIIAPYPAGGSIDMVARLVGKRLGENLGQTLIVKNISGAGGTVGTTAAAKAAPDGHTLLLASNGPNAIGPSLYAKLGYNAEKDFAAISSLVVQPMFFTVAADSPIKSIKEIIALGKAADKRPTVGSPGIGSAAHLTAELFNMRAETEYVHVPYKGTAPLTLGILSHQVTMGVTSAIDVLPQVKGGKFRALANSAPKRSKSLPDVPTVAESGVPGFDMEVWYGLVAPADTPKAIISRLNAEVVKILAEPQVREKLENVGATPTPSTPDEFDKRIRTDIAKYRPVVKRSGARVE